MEQDRTVNVLTDQPNPPSWAAVRVLNCQGGGSVSTEAAGVDWVTGNAVLPAVANMSLYTGVRNEPSRVLDDAVRASIVKGVSYVVAAGNFNDDPARPPGPAHRPTRTRSPRTPPTAPPSSPSAAPTEAEGGGLAEAALRLGNS